MSSYKARQGHICGLRERDWGNALKYVIRKLFCREIAILKKRTCLNLDVANGAELLDESTKWMKGADRLLTN